MKNLISSLFIAGVLATCSLANALEYSYNSLPTVQFVYTDKPCTNAVPEEGFKAHIVEAYVIDTAHNKRADGCAAIFMHERYGVEAVHFQIPFVDSEGVKATIDQLFPTSVFKEVEYY